MQTITVDPITRLEGHGKFDIFLNDEGEVENVYFQIPELRGIEKFCEGRPVEELPRITQRACGVCPGPHHMAASKACDGVYGVEPPPAGKKLRELFLNAHFLHSHIAHFYALAAPDFVVGPQADPTTRHVLGVIAKVGLEVGGQVIASRAKAQRIQAILGGKATHAVCGIPGGMSKALTSPEEVAEIRSHCRDLVEFGKFTLRLFDQVVLQNAAYVDLILNGPYTMKTYYMGLVDPQGRVTFYDGTLRVIDEDGAEFLRFDPRRYTDHIAEHVEPWSYLKFPYLKAIGWKGLVAGKDSGVYRVAPLARLNVATGMATPVAQEAYEQYFQVLGPGPVHATLANHWARVIELMYAAERCLELIEDPETTSPEVRTIPTGIVGEGVGVVEAPRGTLFHHYRTDDQGFVTRCNMLVATGNNNAAICMSIRDAAKGLIRKGVEVTEGILNQIEMAFRAYDPCFGCATHSLPGQMPMEVRILDPHRVVRQTLVR
ncbi:MAG TPA: Ni/Fe hydrogenase subunit alpha [Myxococcota bacterium]|nr:Ni/Fe hydrogenase subunit alpha [Myxococcota bacterium]HQK50069.1 Ni/Fe hydrogenase subunit alpha [Myxococcota bacterium]